MVTTNDDEISTLLTAWRDGDEAARNRLFEVLYDDLSTIASRLLKREHNHISLFTGDLVSEAVVRLIQAAEIDVIGKNHLLALSARVMRHVLVDNARRKKRHKRDGINVTISEADKGPGALEFDTLALDRALVRLKVIDPESADIVVMRYYGGMNIEAVASVLGVSPATVKRKWAAIRLWLQEAIKNDI